MYLIKFNDMKHKMYVKWLVEECTTGTYWASFVEDGLYFYKKIKRLKCQGPNICSSTFPKVQ